ncbi:MAG: CdaR family protein [Finegoldia sp.]|nr:CdaR family protein [Finegoldia sp.]
MKDKFKENLVTKIVCLLLAVFLWSYVMGMENPKVTREIRDVKIEYKNLDKLAEAKRVIIEPESPTMSVTIEGRRNEINKIKPEDIGASVDVSQIQSDSQSLPIKINALLGVSVINQSDQILVVNSQPISTEKVEINVSSVGKLPEGVEVSSIRLDPEIISISGAQKYLDDFEYALVRLDNSKITGDLNLEMPIEMVTSGSNKASDHITKSHENAKVVIETKITKEVPITVRYTGSPPKELSLDSITTLPKTVKITGKDIDINSIESIETQPIDLSKISESKSVDVGLSIPPNAKLEDESNRSVTAEVNLK